MAVIAIGTEGGRRERLQGVVQHQLSSRRTGVGMPVGGHLQQVRYQWRGLARTAIGRVGAQPAQVEHVLGGGQQLQQQEAVVLTGGTVAGPALVTVQFGGQAVQPAGRIAAREVAIVHAQHADHPERQQPHRHHPREADPAGQQGRPGVGLAEHAGEMRTHHLGRQRCLESASGRLAGELVDLPAQALQRALLAAVSR